jgi:hypothetical protein
MDELAWLGRKDLLEETVHSHVASPGNGISRRCLGFGLESLSLTTIAWEVSEFSSFAHSGRAIIRENRALSFFSGCDKNWAAALDGFTHHDGQRTKRDPKTRLGRDITCSLDSQSFI